MDAVAIMLSGPYLRQVHVPDLIALLLHSNARRVSVGVGSVEQAEFHSRGILGKDGEVDSLAIPCGSQWIGGARPSSHFSSLRIYLLVVKHNSLPVQFVPSS